MAFRAVHAQWGTVFAHLPDLDCGRAWDEVWKVRPPAPLTCDECGHAMYAKTSRAGLRFFAHAPGSPLARSPWSPSPTTCSSWNFPTALPASGSLVWAV